MPRLYNFTLLSAKTAQGEIGYANTVAVANQDEFGFYVTFDHTSAAGVISIETAPSDDYAGTWAVLKTITWSAIDKCHYESVTGALRSVRARITSAVTSGTCTVYMVCNAQ